MRLVVLRLNGMSEIYGYIYMTKNQINGKRYIGQHKSSEWDNYYFGSGKLLKRAIKKYGKENFTCQPLVWALSKEQLDEQEIYFIYYHKPEYNITPGGEGFGGGEKNPMWGKVGDKHPAFGYKHTEEHKQKMSELKKGKKRPEISEKMKGKNHHSFGKHWFTNGEKNIMAFECPEGFKAGRILRVA